MGASGGHGDGLAPRRSGAISGVWDPYGVQQGRERWWTCCRVGLRACDEPGKLSRSATNLLVQPQPVS